LQVSVGDVVSINDKMAVVIEVLDPTQSKEPRCMIKQEGSSYNVLVSDLKDYKG